MNVTGFAGTTFTVTRASETYPGGAAAGTGVAHLSGVAITLIVTANDESLSAGNAPLNAYVSITGTVAMGATNLNANNIFSGTSANYTATMPDATAVPFGTRCFTYMSSALTKLVTLASFAGTQMDGKA